MLNIHCCYRNGDFFFPLYRIRKDFCLRVSISCFCMPRYDQVIWRHLFELDVRLLEFWKMLIQSLWARFWFGRSCIVEPAVAFSIRLYGVSSLNWMSCSRSAGRCCFGVSGRAFRSGRSCLVGPAFVFSMGLRGVGSLNWMSGFWSYGGFCFIVLEGVFSSGRPCLVGPVFVFSIAMRFPSRTPS